MNRKFILPTTIALGLILIALTGVSYVSAQGTGNYPPIVQKIAKKFNLNETDVQAVFDEERQERYAQMYAGWAERLDDLVNDGVITPEQKKAILEKHEEMHNKIFELKGLSFNVRREKMSEIQNEFRNWLSEQGISVNLFGRNFRGLGGEKGLRNGFMMGFH